MRAAVLAVLPAWLFLSAAGPTPPAPAAPAAAAPPPPAGLEIFHRGFPRAFVFRQAEVLSNRLPYEAWEAEMVRLNGIIGKLVAEERLTITPRNRDYFRRFKARHPEKLVLLHFNGFSFLPGFDPSARSEHWLYGAGTTLTAELAPGENETVLEVADTAPFRLAVGRFADRGDDAVIVATGGDGEPLWSRTEHVRITAIDRRARTLRVERAAYGSRPRAFDAGARVAPHIASGPWCAGCDRQWVLNFSTAAPRGPDGRSGADVYVDSVAALVGPGGTLEWLDGVQLDGFPFRPRRARIADVDFDGEADGGVLAGLETYGIGGLEALARLRERLGPGKIIATDGGAGSQRPGFGLLNGIELEGFTGDLRDTSLAGWTSRVDLLDFAQARSRRPGLTYVNYKWAPEQAFPIDYAALRMALAATVFTDTLFTFFIEPGGGSLQGFQDADPGAAVLATGLTVFDELVKGEEGEANWLGLPQGPARHRARENPDLVAARGAAWEAELVGALAAGASPGTSWRRLEGGGVRLAAGGAEEVRFSLPLGESPDADLLVEALLSAAPPAALGAGVARQVRVAVAGREATSLVGERPHRSLIYLRAVGPGPLELTVEVEGGEPVAIHELAVRPGPDLVYRQFRNGLVVANPSTRPLSLDLARRFPGVRFRRLRGTPDQDPATNDGSPVGATLTLPPEDALFLVRER